MSVFDLVLVLLVLGTAVGVVAGVVALFFRRWAVAIRLLAGVVVLWVVYLGTGTAVAVLTPQRTMAIGEDRCFDEMCFAVTGSRRTPAIETAGGVTKPQGAFLIVDVRISNRSRGRAQRENGRKGVLLDQAGNIYEVSERGMQALTEVDGQLPGLDSRVGPGESLSSKLVFDIPESATHAAFALGSDLAFNPARIVIADESHFLHKPTIVPLD